MGHRGFSHDDPSKISCVWPSVLEGDIRIVWLAVRWRLGVDDWWQPTMAMCFKYSTKQCIHISKEPEVAITVWQSSSQPHAHNRRNLFSNQPTSLPSSVRISRQARLRTISKPSSSNNIMSDTEDKSSKKKSGANSKTYEERCEAVNVICHPLASEKSTKKIHKLVKKASSKKVIRRGVKEVIKGIRKGEKGLAILAGDIYPVDVISHIPILLEEKEIPYLFVPSKQDLGAAACTKRPTSVVLIKSPLPKEFDGQELYDKLSKEAKTYDPSGIMSR